MDINEQTILKRDPNRQTRKYLKGTIIEPGLTLNETASTIFQLIDDQRTVGDICQMIVQEYDIDYSTCLKDVIALANELLAEGVLIPQEAVDNRLK